MSAKDSDPPTPGRDVAGRFTAGNPGGPGNPHAAQLSRLRSALLRSTSDDAIETIMARLIELAGDGNVPADQEVLDRCLGRSADAADLHERVDRLEGLVKAGQIRRVW